MLKIDHSDNICTVGWTCIWASMTPEDMQYLLDDCPRGRFIPTFYDPDRQGYRWTPELLRESLKEIQSKWIKSRGFYFDFPIDDQGVELLKSLGFDPSKCRFWSRR